MVFWILAGLVVYLGGVYMAGILLALKIGPVAYMGPRDTLPEPSVLRARALKATANFNENLPVFLVLAVLSLIVDGTDTAQALLGAQIFVISRLVYLGVYLAGIPLVRSAVFMVGFAGLVMMALALL